MAGTAVLASLIGGLIGSQLDHRTTLGPSSPTAGSPTVPVTPTVPVNPASPLNPSAGTNPLDPGSSSGGVSSSGSSGASVSAAASAVAAKVDPGVVDVNTVLGYQNGAGAGTGMVLTSNGEVLTNNHVVDGATRISVTLVSTGRTYRATVVGTDPTQDVAVIQLQGASGLTPISGAGPSTLAVGDSVVAIGNAGGVGGAPSVVTGTVTGLNRTITASDQGGGNPETLHGLIQTDAPIQAGDSGGPLVNMAGKVVGIDTAASAGMRLSSDASVGFAIPLTQALGIASQIQGGKASSTVHLGLPGFIGVAIDPSGQSGVGFGSSGNTNGAVVSSVLPGLPAAAAGLTSGDVITSVNGQTVDSAQTLTAMTTGHKPGDKIALGWTDQSGTAHRATITLATGPAD